MSTYEHQKLSFTTDLAAEFPCRLLTVSRSCVAAPPPLRLCYDLTCSKPLQTLICYDLNSFLDPGRGGEYRTPKQLRLGKNFPMGTPHALIVISSSIPELFPPVTNHQSPINENVAGVAAACSGSDLKNH